MSESEIAERVLSTLHQTASAEPEVALPILKGLVGLVNGDGRPHPLEVEEARFSAFMAICEYAKALHRGQPADALRPVAVSAAEKWRALTC